MGQTNRQPRTHSGDVMLLAQANLIDVYRRRAPFKRLPLYRPIFATGRDHRLAGMLPALRLGGKSCFWRLPTHHRPGGNAEFHYVPLRDSHL